MIRACRASPWRAPRAPRASTPSAWAAARAFTRARRIVSILDFVDLTELSLCTLPSLFGTPRDLDLRGGDASEARRAWLAIEFDRPGFELEAGAVTLAEIQDRAASFDPLTLRTHEDVRAISSHAWFSLGRHGVGLHFQRAGRVSEVLVVRRAGRGKCWEVVMDGRPMERFSRLEAAVEAVDFELERMGRGAVAVGGRGGRVAAGRAAGRRRGARPARREPGRGVAPERVAPFPSARRASDLSCR